MIHVTFSCILLAATVSGLEVQNATKVDLDLGRCMLREGEKIAEDKFIFEMYKAFKEETRMEGPSNISSAKRLKDVEGHELLGRFLVFINTLIHAIDDKDGSETLGRLTELSERYQSEGEVFISEKQWPYRCYNSELMKALDVYLSDMLPQIVSSIKNGTRELGMFFQSVAMSLPQFQDYVEGMDKEPMSSLCLLLEGSHDVGGTVREITTLIQSLSSETSIAQTACSPPYNSQPFCQFPEIQATLELFLLDYQRAGSSTLMKTFSFFWFFEPHLSYFCSGASTKFKTKMLRSFAMLEEKQLTAIVNRQSTSNRAKIRSFIYDHVFNHFTRYMTEEVVKDLKPKYPFSNTHKYNQFQEVKYPSDKPREEFLDCFNTYISALVQMEQVSDISNELSPTRLSQSVESMAQSVAEFVRLWLTDPISYNGTAMSIIAEGVSYLLENSTALKQFGKAVGRCGLSTCKTSGINSMSSSFCKIIKLFGDIKLFAISTDSSPKTKILTGLTADYKQLISQERPWSIQSRLDRNEKGNTRTRRVFSWSQSELTDYFNQAAALSHLKAQRCAKALLRMLESFQKRINEVNLHGKLTKLFQNVLGAVATDLLDVAQPLAEAVLNTFSPLGWLSNVSSIQDVLKRFQQDNQVQVITQMDKIFGNAFHQISVKGIKTMTTRKKRNSYMEVKKLFMNLIDDREIKMDMVLEEDLGNALDNYIPEWPKEDIEEHTALVKDLVESLCDILYGRDRHLEVMSNCLDIRKDATIIGAIHEEMYDFQFEFIENMISIYHSLMIEQRASELAKISSRADVHRSGLKREIFKLRVKLQTKLQLYHALKAICDELEYKNGGTPTKECLTAMVTLSQADSQKVLLANVNECPSSQMTTVHVLIPGILNPNKEIVEKGDIDLTALYAGRQTTFEIPFSENLPWLNKFASGALPVSPDVAMYLKQFEVFLPETSGLLLEPKAYDLGIRISHGNFAKTRPSGKIKYAFSGEKIFNLIYGENEVTCDTGFKDSPYPKLCQQPKAVCLKKRGELPANEIAPPLYGKWLIRGSLPEGLPIPRPHQGTSFYLRAVMSICVSNPKNINLASSSPPISITGSSGQCCPEGGFWNIDQNMPSVQFCLQCPVNSVPKLGGLYCHQTSPKELDRKKKNRHKTRNVFLKDTHTKKNISKRKQHYKNTATRFSKNVNQ